MVALGVEGTSAVQKLRDDLAKVRDLLEAARNLIADLKRIVAEKQRIIDEREKEQHRKTTDAAAPFLKLMMNINDGNLRKPAHI